jgi:hypothetical protein
MEPLTNRIKAGWIIAFTMIGWLFFLLPMTGEDIPEGQPTPISQQAWITWIIINFVMLILVHLLISKEHRAMKRGIKTMKRVELARQMHPTRKHD